MTAHEFNMTTLSRVIGNDEMKWITDQFSRLKDKCYLESAGAALYPKNLINAVNDDLLNNTFMNPHTDKYTRDCIEHIRSLTLNHFNTDSSSYDVIFTSGTTQSLKLVVESFRFSETQDKNAKEGSFVYLNENHTSVLGLREIAADKNADIIHISHNDFLDAVRDQTNMFSSSNLQDQSINNSLFVYPAESNFNGFKYPIDCMGNIRNGCLNSIIDGHPWKVNRKWFIMLDAATFLGTNKLDLSKSRPDFVVLSFYKIFGYPTGLGALLIKKRSASILDDKRYYGGGTVDVVLSSERFHVKRTDIHERFEDGTTSFLSILALKHCFDVLHSLIPKSVNNDLMETISHHTFYLAKDLYDQLKGLKHKNGTKAAVLYMDSDFSDVTKQGGIVTFNIVRDDGTYIGYNEFQHMADLFGICVRTGCFCNSGSCQRHFKKTNKDIKLLYQSGHTCSGNIDLMDGEPTGAIRASFAYYNTFNDVDKLMKMICRCFVNTPLVRPNRSLVSWNKGVVTEMKAEYHNNNNGLEPELSHYSEESEEKIEFDVQAEETAVLKEIALFPIKSCGAFKVKSWPIGDKGFAYDREWMITNHNGVCLTQKNNTRMCLIKPTIHVNRNLLVLHCKGRVPISIPLNVSANKSQFTQVCQTKVCADMIKGYDCGDEVAQWISEALETSFLRLIRQASDDQRQLKSKNPDSSGKILSLSNQAQFLLINKASVRWLKKKIKDDSFMDEVDALIDRFRGNIIVDTSTELVEKQWQRVIIGDHEFNVQGACTRCQMICIDQQTGNKTVEPLRTISEAFSGKMKFGIYLTYIGPVNGPASQPLAVNAPVKPIMGDDLSR
ncbi:hypothetical protein JYU34_022637 [Plutella xylostella]|uniref:Molybdenum cofactor sulfurase n=2 Tax=Plutella xylostella TaxID=51655 RepID=A0ABQ7PQ97_PLUXY|nr:hypothetical protein JYU34_022637 [Plutella xylostella]